MKKNITTFTALLLGCIAYGQVGIKTTAPESTLDIRATNHLGTVSATDGLLAPRVNSLAGNGSVDGQLVYLTAASGSYAKGLHYWDQATVKWIPFGQAMAPDNSDDAWANDSGNNRLHLVNNSNGSPRTDATKNVYITDSGKLGIGTNPNTKVDVRRNPTSTTDPGVGIIAIGGTADAANVAGAGALRYQSTSAGQLLYSDGENWRAIEKQSTRLSVIAQKTSAQSIPDQSSTHITDWSTINDNSGGAFNANGTFTAPRAGNYAVSFSYSFAANTSIVNNSRVEAQVEITRGSVITLRKAVIGYPVAGTGQPGATMSLTLRLEEGDQVRPKIFQYLGGSRNLTTVAGYNLFSVVEL